MSTSPEKASVQMASLKNPQRLQTMTMGSGMSCELHVVAWARETSVQQVCKVGVGGSVERDLGTKIASYRYDNAPRVILSSLERTRRAARGCLKGDSPRRARCGR